MITKYYFNGLNIFLSILMRITPALCLFLPITSSAEPTTVILVPSSNSGIYSTTIDNIRSSINSLTKNRIDLKVLTPDEISRQGPDIFNHSKLIVPIGQHALKRIVEYSGSSPILATLISRYSYHEVLEKNSNVTNAIRIGAVYIDQPVIRQIRLAQLLLPGDKKLGFLVSRKNLKYLDVLKKLPKNNNHFIKLLNHHDNIINEVMETLDNSDVFVCLPDPFIFNKRTARSILLSSYRKRKPVIGFSSAYVRAGALAAVYSTPAQIGKQTGELIYQFLQESNIKQLHTYDAKYFSIALNTNVARSLGLSVPDAKTIEHQLIRMENDLD
jgi:putative ABC transport system substrate-binding protein